MCFRTEALCCFVILHYDKYRIIAAQRTDNRLIAHCVDCHCSCLTQARQRLDDHDVLCGIDIGYALFEDIAQASRKAALYFRGCDRILVFTGSSRKDFD